MNTKENTAVMGAIHGLIQTLEKPHDFDLVQSLLNLARFRAGLKEGMLVFSRETPDGANVVNFTDGHATGYRRVVLKKPTSQFPVIVDPSEVYPTRELRDIA